MTILKAPLFSFGASGQIAKSLVYLGWKGLNTVRSYVVPANPRTDPQLIQRGFFTEVVDRIHYAQSLAADPLIAIDITAYAALASTIKAALTWFNALVAQGLDQLRPGLNFAIFRDGAFTAGAAQVTCHLEWTKGDAVVPSITAGNWHYGTSPTALIHTEAATIVADSIDNVIAALAPGIKYYFQFRSTLDASFLGTQSGIYHATPT